MTGFRIYHFAVRKLSAFEPFRLAKKQFVKGSDKRVKPSVLAVGSVDKVSGII